MHLLSGNLYYITFTDESTDETRVYFLKKKSDNFAIYKHYEAWVKKHRNSDGIKSLHSDQGGNYLSDEFIEHLKSNGTHQELTVHDLPQQNGKAKRLNRIVVETGRTVLISSGLPQFLWSEAFNHAIWLRKRVTRRVLNGNTTFEVVHNRKPDLGGIQPFGATV